ncbi:uncharacterized protein LOC113328512 [Papaver somniferum]|uniref:uncharacterized protein LOC113328512 n=1 Tax=Papaver somniferum TaxID=3469 RepID=UPI000E704044|nr:uncharacterized protein LOC113328512 [Papaver somniferum]XP_026431376.1 uncharacterized protein LOC113328512 [Papaver somniferum]XP_026431377.1 uncharacterized protein LOC113328512 [Papaver somniferum]
MGTDAIEIGGIPLRKFLILPIKISYRSTSKHPLIVGFVLFSLLLYRFLPFLFVLLVSSSPVLVSTFVLLGTLLSYGQHSHIPQIDEEDDDVQEVASTRNTEIEPLNCLEEESNQKYHSHELLPPKLRDSFGSIEDTSLMWKKIKDQDDADEEDESFNSDSDGAESSFLDASITDATPMINELHPLLDTETPHCDVHESSSDDEFNAASDRSHSSNDIHVESSEEVESREEDDDEEEGQCETAEGGTKAVLKWTEDDEKNLMDLGNSEVERNQRLESLIARRRARKSFRMSESEMNMMDLDFNGPPFQIAPISTGRRNPFDLHYDSYMGPGLPPMPGSAPSVMLPRRNPFDLPYDDPLEERPDLAGDSFGEEFMTAHEKDMHYRRCESFNMGAYFFKDHRQEKNNVSRFKPHFVTEEMASEGRFSRFSRQMSEASESKMSFASETESHSTIANQEDLTDLVEEQLSFQECDLNPAVEHTPERVKLESELLEELHLDSDVVNEAKDEIDLFKVGDANAGTKTFHGTQSRFYSEFIALEEHLTGYVHVNQELGEEQQHTSSSSHSSSGVHEKIEEKSEGEESSHGKQSSSVQVHQDMVQQQQHTRSNPHSSSDVHEKIFDVNVEEELSGLDPERGDVHEHSANFMQQTVVDSDFLERVGGEDDSHTEAPVYDSSPSASNQGISDMMRMEETMSYKNSVLFTSTSSVNA